MENLGNWAGNYTYKAARIHRPESLEQLQELVPRCQTLKALGTRHSFNDVADTTGDLVSLERFAKIGTLDRTAHTVTVEAGIRYGTLCRYLHQEGYALHNLASLPHISVAGACATATHGSGVGNGNLSTAVLGIEMVTADGSVVALSRDRDGDTFAGAVVGLGGLGVVTQLTLSVEPTYTMRQVVYENLSLAQLEKNFDAILGGAYSVSLFTRWQGDTVDQVWRKERVTEDTTDTLALQWFGATLAPDHRHPIGQISPENCTPQMGIPGPWQERLPHFRMEYTPSSGEELQSEYLVPHPNALEALHAIHRLREHVAPLLQISEVRTIAADDLWMSPCYHQPCVAFHFTWIKDWPAVRSLLPLLENKLAPLGARPHWGKLFTMSREQVQPLYPRLADFQNLLQRYDPQGKFRNAFLDAYIV